MMKNIAITFIFACCTLSLAAQDLAHYKRVISPGVHGEFPVYHVDKLNYDAERMFADLAKPETVSVTNKKEDY